MQPLLESMDYRAWLKERTEELKREKPFFSYRYIGLKLGLDSAQVARILTSQAHLALKHVPSIAKLYILDHRESKYFEELVRFARSRTDAEAAQHMDQLQVIRGLNYRTVADAQGEFYSTWYHMSIRSVLSIAQIRNGDFSLLARRMKPVITPQQAEESIALLQRLDLVRVDAQGFYEVTDSIVSTGENWKAPIIRNYQRTQIQMSAEALERFHKEERDISSLTLPLNRSLLPILKDRLRDLRQEFLKLSQDCEESDAVFQLNLQLFPQAYLASQEVRRGH